MSFLQKLESCAFCQSVDFEEAHRYLEPPPEETDFDISENYDRRYMRCVKCGHFYSQHQIDLSFLYEQDYVDKTYPGDDGIDKAFDRIISLPEEKSDNFARCRRVHEFFGEESGLKLLDVGGGLGVFPYGMKQKGWECTAIDLDQRQIDHLNNHAKITAYKTGLPANIELGKFNLISLNKVLEHIEQPIPVLEATKDLLVSGGKLYIELPDGESAAKDSFNCEEFFIEHHHVFSKESFRLFLENAGFRVLALARIVEPSGKYTLYAFAQLA